MNQQGVMTTLECAPVPVQHNYKHTCVSWTAQQTCFNFLFDQKKKKPDREKLFFSYILCPFNSDNCCFFYTHRRRCCNIYIFSSSAMLRDELLFFLFHYYDSQAVWAARHIVTIHLYCFIISSCCGGGGTSWRDVQKFIFILNNARAQLFYFFFKSKFFCWDFSFPSNVE